jgi:hypothetical protein
MTYGDRSDHGPRSTTSESGTSSSPREALGAPYASPTWLGSLPGPSPWPQGNWLAAKAHDEVVQHEIEVERAELASDPAGDSASSLRCTERAGYPYRCRHRRPHP